MPPEKLLRAAFWMSVATASAIPFVLVAFKLRYPPEAMNVERTVAGLASMALNVLGGMGDGVLQMLWIAGFAAATFVATLASFSAAWVARESRRTKIICLLPALLVVIVLVVLLAIGA